MGTRNVYSTTITAVGSVLKEGLVQVPFRGLIHRVNFFVSAGTAVSQVRGQVGKGIGATGNNVLAKYSLSPETLPPSPTNDVILGLLSSQEGGIYYSVVPVPNTLYGFLVVSVAADNAVLDHTVGVELTIEDLFP
jgi:hypothetical protein